MTRRIAIVGGGIAGVTAAWQVARLAREVASAGARVEATLFESLGRLGGIVETVNCGGFVIECGPDAWVTEKPWARDLVDELGLSAELLASNDEVRKTHILLDGRLQTMPDGMRMMVPVDLHAMEASGLFSGSAKAAYHSELVRAGELKEEAPREDESIASFTRRHFGEEVLTRIAAPLLSGVLGGDVETLSVQAVMPQFVAMEREWGSLIAALQARGQRGSAPIFTTLRGGLSTLIERMVADIPPGWIRPECEVSAMSRDARGWSLRLGGSGREEIFDAVFVATPTHVACGLIRPLSAEAAGLMRMEASSAIVVALGFRQAEHLRLPQGFGFLVPPSCESRLLACTFTDQKFAGRVPEGGRLVRAFFGGVAAEALLGMSDEEIAVVAREELERVLGPLPDPSVAAVRRWPKSLPQYAVGHLGRMAELRKWVAGMPGLTLLGNGYNGVGLPDLIRDARSAARSVAPKDPL